MDSKHIANTKKTKESAARPTSSHTAPEPEPDPDLPRYYDSEPSSQPPNYNKAASSGTTGTLHPPSRPQAQHTGSGALASTVAALLAPPEPKPKEKKPLRERWRDFKERNFLTDISDAEYWDNTVRGSDSRWNVFGASVSGYDRERIRRGP
jgi:hypothetical protein